MSDTVLEETDFPRYQRWINRALGRERPVKIFDAAGHPLWGGDPALDRALVAADKGDVAGIRRHKMDAENMLLYRPLRLNGKGLVGWAGMVTTQEETRAAPLEVDRAADALDDMASGILDDLAQRSDLLKMTEELAQCYEELRLIYDINEQVQNRLGQDENIFRDLMQSTADRMNIDLVAFVRPGERVCIHAQALSKEINNLDLVLVELSGDLFRFVQSSGETLVLNEAGDPRRAYILTDMPYRVLACPVRSEHKGDSIVVLLNHMHKNPYTNNDRRLAEVMASQLSSLAKSYLLIRNMSQFTEQLAKALVEAVEAKDPYTRGHSERVNFLSMEIGRAIGLREEELDDLHWGSLLHDVGKIGIPDAILCKPAKLTEDEYTFIKVHPERSYDILRHIERLKNAMPGVRHHQEMFDGKGYPHGLKGKRIPLQARIIAVADTYDSITSSRAYRAGRSHEQALAEIERVSGTQLDPDIVDVFKPLCAAEPGWLKRFNIRRDAAS